MAFRSVGTGVHGSGTAAAVPVPSCQSGDVIVLGLYVENTNSNSLNFTPPTGMTLKSDTGTTLADTRGRILVFWKRVTATNDATDEADGTYDLSWTTSCNYEAVAIAYSGIVSTGDPFEGVAVGVSGNSTGTTVNTTAVTTAATDDLVSFASNHATNAGNWTPPTGFTERYDNNASATAHLTAATKDSVAAGSQQHTFTLTGTTGSSYPRAWLGALTLGATNFNGTAALAASDSMTAAGTVGAVTGASASETATLTGAGVVGAVVGAALAVTATLTASGVVGTQGDASLAATASLAADGTVTVAGQGDASLDASAALTATGTVATGSDASLAETATLTAAGQVDAPSGASLSAAATLTASGVVGVYGDAALAVTATLRADWSPPPLDTDTSNRDDGIDLDGVSRAWMTPAIVPTPTRLVGAQVYTKARAYTAVTVTGQRLPNGLYPNDQVEKTARARDRILVGGVDITYAEGIRTPAPDFTLIDPLLYGSGTLLLPQYNAELYVVPSWLKKDARVEVQRVLGTDVTTDYVGFVTDFVPEDHGDDGWWWRVNLAGHGAGKLSADQYVPPPVFVKTHDGGFLIIDQLRSVGLHAKPANGPDLGVPMRRRGGTDALTIVNETLALCSTNANGSLTCLPNQNLVYRIHERDLETIDGTIYLDAEFISATPGTSLLEEPNVVFATGRTPDGELVNFAVAPGAVQGTPLAFPGSLSFGDTGDDVAAFQQQLGTTRFLNIADVPFIGEFDAATLDAVEELQEEAGLTVNGIVNEATWDAAWDLGVTGFSIDQARILPAAERQSQRKWNLSATGAKISRNPNYRPGRRVSIGIDVGTGFYRHRIKKFARSKLAPIDRTHWAGQAVFNSGLIRGDHTPGDAITSADVMDARELRPGMNLKAPFWDGGTVFHVTGLDVSNDGATVTVMLDTQLRSSIESWEAIQQRRDSRSNPARQWTGGLRASSVRSDSMNDWTDICGKLGGQGVACTGGTWTEFPIFSGQTGVLQQVKMSVRPPQEFAVMVAGRRFSVNRLNNRVPNPLAPGRVSTARTVSVTTTSGLTAISSSGDFRSSDEGKPISGPGIPADASITAFTGSSSAILSAAATASGTISASIGGTEVVAGRPWYERDDLAKWLDEHKVLYAEGTWRNPCGYSPSLKTDAETTLLTGSQVTGDHKDFGGGDYETDSGFALWVYVWVPITTTVQPGQILFEQITSTI